MRHIQLACLSSDYHYINNRSTIDLPVIECIVENADEEMYPIDKPSDQPTDTPSTTPLWQALYLEPWQAPRHTLDIQTVQDISIGDGEWTWTV